jgi:amidophosphoribosyltransferase
MSDEIKHECGIALVRLLKPLSYYTEKYGSPFYGLNKMYLLMQKQHNRGQDGAGLASIKFDVEPGTRYISRIRSKESQPIQDIFSKINTTINEIGQQNLDKKNDPDWQINNLPYIGNLFLGHVRYGTFGKNGIESVHPFIRRSNWKHKGLIVAGNFNMTNSAKLFEDLVELGQHPKEFTDTVTVMEKIGHFLEDEVENIYREIKNRDEVTKKEASPMIGEQIDVGRILKRSSKNWDGGYVMAGMLGHGDAFVMRDPAGIRPAYYYADDEIVVVASERPAIQTVFNVEQNDIKELESGHALIIKKNGNIFSEEINKPLPKKSCSFERIYFSRGNDAEIYQERKELGRLVFPQILEKIDSDIDHTVFSYIPNTAEVSFFGMHEAASEFLNEQKTEIILKGQRSLSAEKVRGILKVKPRIEKLTIKDVSLRTFITSDSTRDDLVAHVYDVTYGIVKSDDYLVIIDDSIVRGTTLKKSVIKILDRLHPKKIVIVSSAPQIRYPDCYGIDMAKLGDFIAFKAAMELLKDTDQQHVVEEVYKKCKEQQHLKGEEIKNAVTAIYASFTDEQISDKIATMLKTAEIKSPIEVVYQKVENLHKACPNHLGDWYFTGNYPTPGGNRVVNNAFINFYEGNDRRAY